VTFSYVVIVSIAFFCESAEEDRLRVASLFIVTNALEMKRLDDCSEVVIN
jgi:hypothetical protein